MGLVLLTIGILFIISILLTQPEKYKSEDIADILYDEADGDYGKIREAIEEVYKHSKYKNGLDLYQVIEVLRRNK